MKKYYALFISASLLVASFGVNAQLPTKPPVAAAAKGSATSPAGAVSGLAGEKGWFYFEEKPLPPEEEEVEPPVLAAKPKAPEPPKEEKCKKGATWSADCGFVNPGDDFAFQAKQRDALMERMAVAQNDPKAVEAVQYYMRWVLERTSEVANLWWYNMVQNPELDPTAAQPISAMGLRLMTEVRKGAEGEVFDLVRDEGGMFVYFSRSDCEFCHQMEAPLRMLETRTKLKVRNASLDSKCMPKYEDGCVSGESAIAAAQALKVTTVPSVFLYVQPNTWIRVATGISDTDSMATRSMQFFTAYRTALLKGVENSEDGRPSVDFGSAGPTGNKATGLGAPPTKKSTEVVIDDLLGRKR